MRRLLALCLLLACGRRISGPTPVVSGARSEQDGSASPAALCNAQSGSAADGWLLDVLGQNFAPLPTNALSGTPGVVMPQVTLSGPEIYLVPESRVRFADATRLVLEMPTRDSTAGAHRLAAGDYSVAVSNLGGSADSAPAAVRVVDPPQIQGLQVAPPAGSPGSARICNDSDQTLIVTGTGFRGGAPPTLSLVNGPGGAAVPLVVAGTSATAITAFIPRSSFSGPTSATGASYTVSVQDPAGCVAPWGNFPRSFGVTDVKAYPTCKTLGSPSVTPSFGWSQRNQRITIHVNGSGSALFTGGAPSVTITARLKGSPAPITFPLRSVGFIDANTVTAVVPTCSGTASLPTSDPSAGGCPNGIAPGDAYSIEIDDPTGAFGTVQFAVIGPELPTIASISPPAIDTSGTADLAIASGGASGSTFPAAAKAQIVFGVTGSNGVVRACDLPLVSSSASSIHAKVQALPQTACVEFDAMGRQVAATNGFTLNPGLYIIRVQDSASAAYGDSTGLVITSPGATPVSGTALTGSLSTARASFAMVQGADDSGAPFLYALGGITAPIGKSSPSPVLASVEVGALDGLGDVASFQNTTPLTSARRGLAAVALQVPGDTGYVFVLGGVDAQGNPLATVERAQILKTADAPVIDARPDVGGFLFAGSFYYRVSAVLSASDPKNPGGETLASDLQPATVGGGGKVVLSWPCVPNAASYRIYRTGLANQPATTFRQIGGAMQATVTCTGSPLPRETFTDGGNLALGQVPPPRGALGKWMPMPSLGAARGEAAARLVADRIYLVGGCGTGSCDGSLGNELASYESTRLTAADPGAFSSGPLAAPRRRTALALASKLSAPDRFADASAAWLVVTGGESASSPGLSAANLFEVAQVVSGGGAVGAPTFSTAGYTLPITATTLSGGWAEVAGDLLLAYGSTGAATFALETGDVCNGAPCAGATSFTGSLAASTASITNRYLPGEAFWTGFVYAGGGLTNSTSGPASTASALSTVDRILY